MGWVRFDDASEGHPKFLRAGLAAEGLHKRACCYSSRHLTDGFVPSEWIARNIYTLRLKERGAVIDVLVAEELFEPVDGGYMVHDFLDFNPSRTSVLERRESDRKRKGIPNDSKRNPDGIQSAPSRALPPRAGSGQLTNDEREGEGGIDARALGLTGPAGEACSILTARNWTVDPLGVEQAVYRCQQVGVDPVEAARHAIVLSSGQGHWQNAARALSMAADDLKRREQGASVRAVGPPALRLANAGDLSRFDRLDEIQTKAKESK